MKGQGAAVIKALTVSAKNQGVDFELGAPVKRIIKKRGQIVGVVTERDGEKGEIAARAVLIASGGYANNKEWIKRFCGFDLDVNMMPIGNVDKTGDGIRMAFEVGPAEEGLGVLETYAAGPFGEGFAMKGPLEMVSAQPDLWVDPFGERYCDESIAFYDMSMGNANARYPEGFTYRLLDDSILQTLMEQGIEKQLGMDNPPGTRPVDFEKELKAAEERGGKEVFVAGSAEELAQKMGVDSGVLKTTIEEYNGFCARGHDELFAKNPRYLRPLEGTEILRREGAHPVSRHVGRHQDQPPYQGPGQEGEGHSRPVCRGVRCGRNVGRQLLHQGLVRPVGCFRSELRANSTEERDRVSKTMRMEPRDSL